MLEWSINFIIDSLSFEPKKKVKCQDCEEELLFNKSAIAQKNWYAKLSLQTASLKENFPQIIIIFSQKLYFINS